MKSLIIKELRERMPVLVIGLILGFCPALIIFIYSMSNPSELARQNLGSVVCLLEYLALAIFYTMFITGTSIAGEVERKNISFLFSLPLSRAKIWLVKFAASILSMGLILGVFLIVNSRLMELNKIVKSYHDGFTLILISLPILVLAISIFSSAVSSRETASSGLSLLFLIMVLLILALSSYMLDWFQSTRSLAAALSGWVLFFIICSLLIFVKADYFDTFKKNMTGAKISALGLLAVIALQITVAWLDVAMPEGKPFPWNISTNRKGDMVFQIYYDTHSGGSRYIPDTRLLLMKEPGHKMKSIAHNAVAGFELNPSGEIDYLLFRNSQVLGHIISPTATMEMWRSDFSGRNKRKLYSTAINIRDWHEMSYAYDRGRTYAMIPGMEIDREGPHTLLILSPSGAVERTLPVPGYVSTERGVHLRVIGGKLFIQSRTYSSGRTEGNYEFGALYRLDLETGAVDTLYDLNSMKPPSSMAGKNGKAPSQIEVVSHVDTNTRMISPSGTMQLLRRSFRGDKEHIRDELYLADLDRNGKQKMIASTSGLIRNLNWRDGKVIYTCSGQYGSEAASIKSQVVQYDTASGSSKILFEAGSREMLYTTRSQFSRYNEYGEYAGVESGADSGPVEHFLLHILNRDTKKIGLVLLSLNDGSASTLLEGKMIGDAILSPDLKQLAFFRTDRTLPPWHDRYRGDASLWIKDVVTGEELKVRDFPNVDIILHSPHSVDITWRNDLELIFTEEPLKIFSVTEKGHSVKPVYP